MTPKSDITQELERKIKRFISLTLKDVGTEIGEEFDRNFSGKLSSMNIGHAVNSVMTKAGDC